jgi:hypothetical protein
MTTKFWTVQSKFLDGLEGHYFKNGCIESPRNIRFKDKVYNARKIAWQIETGRWIDKPIFMTCGNPACANFKHMTLTRPAGYCAHTRVKHLMCWGEEFESIQELWENPRCYCRTADALRRRLLRGTPLEQAVQTHFRYMGKIYRSVRAVLEINYLGGETEMNWNRLCERLGSVHGGFKCTVAQAFHEEWWKEVAPICWQRDNIYALTTFRPQWKMASCEVNYCCHLAARRMGMVKRGEAVPLAPVDSYMPTHSELLDMTGPYYEEGYETWLHFRTERPYVSNIRPELRVCGVSASSLVAFMHH